MSLKHPSKLFLTKTMISIPTSCFEVNYQNSKGG